MTFRWGAYVRAYVLVLGEDAPHPWLEDSAVVLDSEGRAHDVYGAGAECVYLLRPDGHIAYRSQPARGPELLAHLSSLLRG